MEAKDYTRRRMNVLVWSIVCLTVLAFIAAAKLASDIVAPTVLAGMFALTLAPVTRALERMRIPSSAAAALVVSAAISVIAISAYALAPTVEDWRWKGPMIIRSLERNFRSIEQKISDSVERATGSQVGGQNGDVAPADAMIESGQKLIADTILSAPQVLVWMLYVGFLSYFLLSERAHVRRAFLSMSVSGHMRLNIARAIRDVRKNVSAYLLIISSVNAGLGAAAFLVFWATGLPSPLLWGAVVGVLNFMPYIGPMIANVVVLIIGLATFQYFGQVILPVVLLATLNMIEGQLVTPMIVGRGSRLSPLAVFLALAFGAWLWGAIGALVATPVLIVATSVWRQMAR
jgi:predicted PurR-regulated permease PerM